MTLRSVFSIYHAGTASRLPPTTSLHLAVYLTLSQARAVDNKHERFMRS